MKLKNIITLILLTTSLVASDMPTSSAELHKQGLNSYAKKEYKKAYEYLKTYAQLKTLSKREKFFLARSAYEIGEYDFALNLYIDIVSADDENLRVHLELAQTYYKLEQNEKAREKFYFVLKQDIPEVVRQNINKILAKMKKSEKKHFFSANLYAGLSYDNNVENGSDAGEYSIYVPSLGSMTLSNDGKKINDTIFETALSVNHNFLLNTSSYIQNKFTAATYRYKDTDTKNLDVLSLGSEYNRYYEKLKLSFGASYDYVSLDDQKYLDGFSLYLPKIEYAIDSTKRYFGHIKYNQQRFTQDSDKGKNSHSWELFNRLAYSNDKLGQNFFDVTLSKTSKEQGSRTDVSKNSFMLGYTNSYPLSKSLILNNKLSFEKDSYRLNDINFLTKREDKKYTVNSTLIKILNQKTTLGASLSYIDNVSNQEPFDYDKYAFKIFMNYQF